MDEASEILARLKSIGKPENLEGMTRYGMNIANRLGISIPEIRVIAKEIGRNHKLALQLWRTGISEARILASMVDDPDQVTPDQMDEWVNDFDSWDVCDQVCMNLFDKTVHVRDKIKEWAQNENEFAKRAAFALMASLAVHDKVSADDVFLDFFPLINKASNDQRNFVKKSVSWALRSIGKRNKELNQESLKFSEELAQKTDKTAKWIASEIQRDLTSEATRKRIKRQIRTQRKRE